LVGTAVQPSSLARPTWSSEQIATVLSKSSTGLDDTVVLDTVHYGSTVDFDSCSIVQMSWVILQVTFVNGGQYRKKCTWF
jgi:hypothetical protein